MAGRSRDRSAPRARRSGERRGERPSVEEPIVQPLAGAIGAPDDLPVKPAEDRFHPGAGAARSLADDHFVGAAQPEHLARAFVEQVEVGLISRQPGGPGGDLGALGAKGG